MSQYNLNVLVGALTYLENMLRNALLCFSGLNKLVRQRLIVVSFSPKVEMMIKNILPSYNRHSGFIFFILFQTFALKLQMRIEIETIN